MRFCCTEKKRWGYGGECMEHSAKGKYVEYSKHKEVVDGLEKRIKQLIRSRKQLGLKEDV
jgi:hypothetical protein